MSLYNIKEIPYPHQDDDKQMKNVNPNSYKVLYQRSIPVFKSPRPHSSGRKRKEENILISKY